LLLQFSNDSRYLASQWIEANVPVNATIEVGERGPAISEEKYKIISSHRDPESMDFARSNRERLEDYRPYQKVRQVIFDLEKWAGQSFGFQVRDQPYIDWFDRVVPSDQSVEESRVQSDYIVLIEDLYPQKVGSLMSPNSGYRFAGKHHFVDPLGLRPAFPFINPPVYIFQRVHSG
jgi:hypothetical protein